MRDRVQPGTVIEGTYRITRRIGEGGMGSVYEASHARLDGRYAVKFLHPDISSRHPGALARFRREARITSALRHPGIVQVVDFHMPTDGPPFLVMEYLEGSTLADVIAREAPFPLARVDDITSQVASALSAAHRKGIVHRDLNPTNIFVVPADGDQPERVKILDFGISKIRPVSKRITGTAQLLGTPQYMAPEQAEGGVKDMDDAADQFSLAAIVYEMLTDHPAFTGDTLAAVAYQVVHTMPASISAFRDGLPPDVERVLARGLAKDKHDRFESITAFAGAFRRAAGGGGGPAAPIKWSEAETAISPPDFLEKLALERGLGRRSARAPADVQQTVVVRRRKRVPMVGQPPGDTPWPGLFSRAGARGRIVAVAAAGVGIAVLVSTLAVRSRGHRHPASPPVLVRAGEPRGPMVQPLHPPVAAAPGPSNVTAVAAVASVATVAPPNVPPKVPPPIFPPIFPPISDATFDLASEPPGLLLWVDGQPFPSADAQAVTRARGTLAPGKHSFELSIPGYETWRRVVDLRPGPATRLHARLRSLEPKSPEALDRPLDRALHDSETDRLESELGLAAIRSDAQPTGHCLFTLGSSPWADLWIDGKDTGKHTPVVQLAVACGKHTL